MTTDYRLVLALVERVHRRSQEGLRRELARLGFQEIEPGQAAVVLDLGQGIISVGDLARRGAYEGPTLSYHLKKLQQAGYIINERTAQDRRVHFVRLSDNGQRLFHALSSFDEQNGTILADLGGDRDLAASARSLQTMERVLQSEEFQDASGPGLERCFSSSACEALRSKAQLSTQPLEDREPKAPEAQGMARVQQYETAREALCEALMTLSVEHREALILVRAENLSYKEAAIVCGVATGTIKSRINRGQESLAASLQQ